MMKVEEKRPCRILRYARLTMDAFLRGCVVEAGTVGRGGSREVLQRHGQRRVGVTDVVQELGDDGNCSERDNV